MPTLFKIRFMCTASAQVGLSITHSNRVLQTTDTVTLTHVQWMFQKHTNIIKMALIFWITRSNRAESKKGQSTFVEMYNKRRRTIIYVQSRCTRVHAEKWLIIISIMIKMGMFYMGTPDFCIYFLFWVRFQWIQFHSCKTKRNEQANALCT